MIEKNNINNTWNIKKKQKDNIKYEPRELI